VTHDPAVLPADLPVPEDDGAADHLPGAEVPSVGLLATDRRTVDLAARSRATTVVVFAYPRTGRPGIDMPAGWDDIPGARGCTPEACSFRDLSGDFAAVGAELYGLSTQDRDYQREAVARLGLTYPLLSDERRAFASALRLPTFEVEGTTLLRRLTMVLRDGRVDRVLYPVFPPDRAAADALAALQAGATPPGRTAPAG
jgi:peroxiredoxin